MGMLRTLRRGVTWTALALAGGAVVVTVRHLLESPQPLQSALNGTAYIDRAHGGEMYYNVAGPVDAAPIVLLHDFSPGASNFAYRDVFGRLASANRVYAPDWLGYGMSERPNIAYTGEFYANVLVGFLRDVVAAPSTVVGLGRAANVVVRAASDAPRLFSRVVLVSPDITAGAQAEPTLAQTLVRATQRAFLGIVPYAVVSTRPVLRYLSARGRERREAGDGAAPSDEALDQRYASAHQFGGQYAPLAMLTGELDLPVRNAFALLEPPALVVIGAEDRQRPAVEVAEWTGVNPRADLEVIPDAGYDVPGDQPRAFVTALDRWLETLPPALGGVPLSGSDRSESATESDMPGLPGYVVPGVSDMGLEGPAAVTIGGITTM
ncbi:MAG TPA: alpha/beta hydrolase, partial [Ktedonobacterales bacterium]